MDNVKPTFNLTLDFEFTAVIRFHLAAVMGLSHKYRLVIKVKSDNC